MSPSAYVGGTRLSGQNDVAGVELIDTGLGLGDVHVRARPRSAGVGSGRPARRSR